jgi:hypothetical protein
MKKKNEEKKTIEEQINEETPITNDQMVNLLYELSKTYTWKAIQRYNLLKDAEVIQSLAVLDPFKEPTQVARTQGIRIGLYYIEKIVQQETERRQRLQRELEGGE